MRLLSITQIFLIPAASDACAARVPFLAIDPARVYRLPAFVMQLVTAVDFVPRFLFFTRSAIVADDASCACEHQERHKDPPRSFQMHRATHGDLESMLLRRILQIQA